MKLYIKNLKLHFKSIMQYKASFIIGFLSQILVFFTYYFVIIALFSKFSNIRGFTLYEVLLTFAVIQFGFSMTETFARGVDHFDELIIDGSFDRLLVRPKPLLLQVLCYKIDYVKVSRLVQAISVLIIAIINMNVIWTIPKIITLIFMLVGSSAIFFGLFLLAASYCFITIQGLEVRNVFTDGGKNMAQYPIGIFKKGFAFIFTYIIPYAFVNYFPLLYIIGKTDNVLYMLSPLVSIIFLIPCLLCFKLGSKKYISVGS